MLEHKRSTELFLKARDELFEFREYYTAALASFEWPSVGAFNWALDWFDAHLASDSNGDALGLQIVGDNAATRSFAQLSTSSNSLANGLRSIGVRRGDRILLLLGNCVELWEIMLASIKLGAVLIPATPLLTASDVEDRTRQASVQYIVTSAEYTDRFSSIGDNVKKIAKGAVDVSWIDFETLRHSDHSFRPDGDTHADDPILVYFTSGTTSRPKLVVHSHRSYGIGHLSTMYWLGLRPGDRHLNVSSPGWAKHAWSCFFAPWNAGACVIVHNQGRFNAGGLLATLVENNVTSLCAPPTVWRMLIQEDLRSYAVALSSACSAGEPLNPEVIEEVQAAWGLTIRDGFGQTETTAQIANSPGQHVVAGSVGRPLPGYDIVLLDKDGAEVEEGEIALRLARSPAGLMCGYLQDDGTILKPMGAFYRTGDIASRGPDGRLTYIGRADDVFKASDYRISPFELESALIEHPAIVEAAVVPVPDPVRMAIPKAFIVLAPGFEASPEMARIIFAYVRKALAPYKRIRRLEFAELPKTISGKIRRVEFRRLEIERARTGEVVPGEYREEQFSPESSELAAPVVRENL